MVPELKMKLGVRTLAMKYPALYTVLPYVVHQVRNKICIVLAIFMMLSYVWSFIDIREAAMISSGCDDIRTEAETRIQFRRWRAVVTRPLVPLARSAPKLFASNSYQRSRELLGEAFDNGMYQISWGYLVVFHDCFSLLVLVVSDNYSNDLAMTPLNATRYQLVTLCRSMCANERAQIVKPLMSSSYGHPTVHVCSLVCVHRLVDCSQD